MQHKIKQIFDGLRHYNYILYVTAMAAMVLEWWVKQPLFQMHSNKVYDSALGGFIAMSVAIWSFILLSGVIAKRVYDGLLMTRLLSSPWKRLMAYFFLFLVQWWVAALLKLAFSGNL